MLVWLHTSSPPQHVYNVAEGTISTEEKLGLWVRGVQGVEQRRGITIPFAGVFEGEHGEVTLHLFTDYHAATGWMQRNYLKHDLLFSSENRTQ